jgi:hypothetical protein
MTRSLSFCAVLLAATSESFSPVGRGFFRAESLSLSAKPKIFIDGEAGTTGLQVRGRLESRDDLEIISPPNELRKNDATRKQFINEADVVIMCTFTSIEALNLFARIGLFVAKKMFSGQLNTVLYRSSRRGISRSSVLGR